jgi:hypothetical protein
MVVTTNRPSRSVSRQNWSCSKMDLGSGRRKIWSAEMGGVWLGPTRQSPQSGANAAARYSPARAPRLPVWCADEAQLVMGRRRRGSIVVLALATGLKLMYRTRVGEDEWRDVDELVPFLWTSMKFGGRRRWFQCLSCGRRCRICTAAGASGAEAVMRFATARRLKRGRIAPPGPSICPGSRSACTGGHKRLAERYER